MSRLLLRTGVGLFTIVLVYSLFVIATVAATTLNHEGIACRDAECGAVSNWLSGATLAVDLRGPRLRRVGTCGCRGRSRALIDI